MRDNMKLPNKPTTCLIIKVGDRQFTSTLNEICVHAHDARVSGGQLLTFTIRIHRLPLEITPQLVEFKKRGFLTPVDNTGGRRFDFFYPENSLNEIGENFLFDKFSDWSLAEKKQKC